MFESFPSSSFFPLMLSLLLHSLSPAYILLSIISILSRHIEILKLWSSHGKTKTKSSTTSKQQQHKQPTTTTTKTTISSSSDWKKNSSNDTIFWISKECFLHFYIVGILSWIFVFVMNYYYNNDNNIVVLSSVLSSSLSSPLAMTTTTVVTHILLLIHLFRRFYETMFIQKSSSTTASATTKTKKATSKSSSSSSSQMHILGYFLGIGHYLVLPFVFFQFEFDLFDSTTTFKSNFHRREEYDDISSSPSSSSSLISFSCNITLLILAFANLYFQYEQYQHHVILASLRRRRQQQRKYNDGKLVEECNKKYPIPPYQRWFTKILCPHYLFEILIYVTFVLLIELIQQQHQQQGDGGNNVLLLGQQNKYHQSTITISTILQSTAYKRHWFLLLWVVTNLTISSLNNMDWYKMNYPKEHIGNRTGLIPKII